MSINHNDAAEALLSGRGFRCEAEPEWVDGRTPDFLCTDRTEFWAEVKSLEDPDAQRLLSKFTRLREREHAVRHDGRVLAVASDDASDRDFKSALAIVDHALASSPDKNVPSAEEIVLIPRDPEYGRHVRITLNTSDGRLVLHCCMSRTGCYGAPMSGASSIDWEEFACVVSDDGSKRQVRARELGLDRYDAFVLALRILTRDGPGFAVQGAMGSGLASKLPTVRKIWKAARDANDQFKNACRHRDLPCLLMIFQDDLLVAEDEVFLSAFYGDLQITWPRDNAEQSSLGFGPDGVWSETQNRTTSAACYVRNRAPPILVHNYWTSKPLPKGLLGGVEYRMGDDGTFHSTVSGDY